MVLIKDLKKELCLANFYFIIFTESYEFETVSQRNKIARTREIHTILKGLKYFFYIYKNCHNKQLTQYIKK